MSIIAKTITEASQAKGEIRAGGTDYMERLRHRTANPSLVDISRLNDLSSIEKVGAGYRIGALVSIQQVADHPELRKLYPGLAIAAGSLANPQIRQAASMGGSLLQRTRCWYYRHPEFSCYKKGGDSCPAREGNHQFGVCFDLGACVFPHPSTLGMALMAYGAEVQLNPDKLMPITDLFGDGKAADHDHRLKAGEILTHIHLPAPVEEEKAAYFRSISRSRAEWPLVEVIVRYRESGDKIADASVAMGGVANVPMVLPKVNAFLNGKTASEETFKQAASLAKEGATPLPQTGYKVDLVEGTVLETLLRAKAGVWGGEG